MEVLTGPDTSSVRPWARQLHRVVSSRLLIPLSGTSPQERHSRVTIGLSLLLSVYFLSLVIMATGSFVFLHTLCTSHFVISHTSLSRHGDITLLSVSVVLQAPFHLTDLFFVPDPEGLKFLSRITLKI